MAQIASLESSLTQRRTESTQELSNLRKTHVLHLAEKQAQVSELESSLRVAKSGFVELQGSLKTITLSVEDERNALRSDVSSLRQSLEESNDNVRRLETSHESSRLDLQSVTKELDGKRSELEVLQTQLVAEARRSAAASDAQEEADGRIHRMEEEVAIMEAAKKADEGVIQRVTASYSKLRELHVGCLAEMDGLVGIVQERKCG